MQNQDKQTTQKKKKYFWVFIVGVLLIISFEFGYEKGVLDKKESLFFQDAPQQNFPENVDFSLYWDAWELLHENYVDADNLDSKELLYGSIQGMMQATGDPYTLFMDPEEKERFDEEIEGTFEGIGAEIGMRDNILTIIAPLEDSPAEKAGLMAGDKIIKIENETTSDMTIEEAVKKIRGPKDTNIKLTVFRNGGAETTKEITVTRGVIEIESVKFEMKEDNIAYVKINRFGETTNQEFIKFLPQISRDAKGIILDLRNNPGGLLDISINIASRMIPRGDDVLIQENKSGERNVISALGGDLLSDIPTVVLINEGSASASEILAGALSDNRDNVTIIGKQSFGKGSVQELISLNGGAVKVTTAKWLTPSGKQINKEGITPDVEVDRTTDDFENNRDPQLDKALETLK